MAMNIKSASRCDLDLASLGECMVRLSPSGRGRVEFAARLEVWVGGGEYNVAYALTRLGLRTAWVGGLVDNPVGRIIVNHARAAGLDIAQAVTVPFDGVGRAARIGLNFTEVGSGVRPSATIYDRGHSATSNLAPGDIDWDELFNRRGVRWFHTGGIFTALSDSTRAVAAEALAGAGTETLAEVEAEALPDAEADAVALAEGDAETLAEDDAEALAVALAAGRGVRAGVLGLSRDRSAPKSMPMSSR